MSNCSNCKNENVNPEAVSYIVHESAMARAERAAKRLWVVIILLIMMLVGTNAAWIWYNAQFEVVETTTEEYQIEQDTEGGGNNNSIIDGGEVVDGEPKN